MAAYVSISALAVFVAVRILWVFFSCVLPEQRRFLRN